MASKRVTRTRPAAPAGSAIGYVRVSTQEQTDSGLGLDAQRRKVEELAASRGLTIVAWHEDAGVSGGTAPAKRPAMCDALAHLADRQATTLVAAKLDRVSRSTEDVLALYRVADREGWSIITADLMVDTTTPAGRMALTMLASFAEFERAMISQRTREALAEKRSQGIQLGKPSQVPTDVVERVCREAYAGATLRTIAAGLMADGIATGGGSATWHAATVRRVLDGRAGVAFTAQLDHEQAAAS